MNSTPNTGYRFNGSGFVSLDVRSYLQKERSAVQFKFQTKALNGLLFLLGNGKHFLSVELRNGAILYQVDFVTDTVFHFTVVHMLNFVKIDLFNM